MSTDIVSKAKSFPLFAEFNEEELAALIELLEYYGFRHTTTLGEDELVYEKRMSSEAVSN